MTKLYGITLSLDEPIMHSTEIIRETKKSFYLENRMEWYNYRSQIPKDWPDIAFSEQEAWLLFIARQERKVERARAHHIREKAILLEAQEKVK